MSPRPISLVRLLTLGKDNRTVFLDHDESSIHSNHQYVLLIASCYPKVFPLTSQISPVRRLTVGISRQEAIALQKTELELLESRLQDLENRVREKQMRLSRPFGDGLRYSRIDLNASDNGVDTCSPSTSDTDYDSTRAPSEFSYSPSCRSRSASSATSCSSFSLCPTTSTAQQIVYSACAIRPIDLHPVDMRKAPSRGKAWMWRWRPRTRDGVRQWHKKINNS